LSKKTGFLSNLGTSTFIDLKSGIKVGVIIIQQAMAYTTLSAPINTLKYNNLTKCQFR